MNPCCANSHMFAPLRVLTIWISLYTYIYSQIYVYHSTDTFVHEPMLCEVTCLCPCENSHFKLYGYIDIFRSIFNQDAEDAEE